MRDIARRARGLIFRRGEFAESVIEFADEGGVGVVEDVECCCCCGGGGSHCVEKGGVRGLGVEMGNGG